MSTIPVPASVSTKVSKKTALVWSVRLCSDLRILVFIVLSYELFILFHQLPLTLMLPLGS